MATDLEKLVVQLSADVKALEKGMARAAGVTNKQFNAIERRARQMNKNLDGIFASTFRGLTAPLAGIGAVLGTAELARLADTWSDLNSRVRLAAGGVEQGNQVMERLGEVARRTYSSLEQTAEGYLANATTLKELGYTTNQTLDFTESLNNALVVSGAKGQRAASVMDALSKAMALGKLSGQNLNTVIAQGGRVAEALAEGLGVGVNQLRALGTQGKITGRDVVRALSSQMEKLRQEAEAMPATISDGIQLLRNALLEYVGNADQATGVSAKISEALVIMADNFDKVADTALQLAAVIAGALVGRSLVKMISTLGLAGSALVKFTQALAAARTMGGLAASMSGLGAVAGPVGLIIGGAVVGAVTHLATSSAEATASANKLAGELEKMGLLAKKSAEGVDETAESIDNLTNGERLRKLRQINDELKRMRSGGGQMYGGGGDEFNSIIADAAKAEGLFGGIFTGYSEGVRRASNEALGEIAKIAAAVRDGGMAAKDALSTLDALAQKDVSQPVVDLIDRLRQSVEYFHAAELAAEKFGASEEVIAGLRGELARAQEEFATIASIQLISEDQQKQVADIIEKFDGSVESAGEAQDALGKVASTLPSAGPYLEVISGIIGKLAEAQRQAAATRAELQMVAGGNNAAAFREAENASMDAYRAMKATNQAFIDSQTKQNALSKQQLAIETEIAKVKKAAAEAGAVLSDKQIRDIATANVAANERRSSEGKKTAAPKKTADDRFDNLLQGIRDRTEAMRIEAEVTGLVYQEQEKRRMALELEQEALKIVREEARKKGDQDWQNAKLSPEQIAKINEMSEAYAQQAEALRLIEEAQGRAESAANEFYDSFKSGMIGALKGAESFSDALSKILEKLADMVLNSAFDSLFNGATSSGGWLTGIFKGLGFSSGGYTGPGPKNKPAGIVHAGEVVWSQDDIRKAGGVAAVEAMRKGGGGMAMPAFSAPVMPKLSNMGGGGGDVNVTYAPSYNITGSGPELDRLRAEMARDRQQFKGRVIDAVADARRRNVNV